MFRALMKRICSLCIDNIYDVISYYLVNYILLVQVSFSSYPIDQFSQCFVGAVVQLMNYTSGLKNVMNSLKMLKQNEKRYLAAVMHVLPF